MQKPSLRGRVARRSLVGRVLPSNFAVCYWRCLKPLSLLRRQFKSKTVHNFVPFFVPSVLKKARKILHGFLNFSFFTKNCGICASHRGTPGEGSPRQNSPPDCFGSPPALSRLLGFRRLRSATKGAAFGICKPLKRLDRNFSFPQKSVMNRFFVRLHRKTADLLTQVKGFLCKLTE